uniref:Aspartate/glutamate/uridylate kinase domain-containing protein n=1 Tax=Phaeodactylum tricornutum TaxID=2850 RepID=A0A8J9TXC2_PHATR
MVMLSLIAFVISTWVAKSYTGIPKSASVRHPHTGPRATGSFTVNVRKSSIAYQFSASTESSDFSTLDGSAPLSVDDSYDELLTGALQISPLSVNDPALVEFTESTHFRKSVRNGKVLPAMGSSHYPFAMMLQGSAPYIAAHAGKTAVIHIPGDVLDGTPNADALLADISLSRLLGMKIVIVIGCRFDLDRCDMDFAENAHECHNALKITNAETLRYVEEEVGFLRTEMERKLNRCLRMTGGVSGTKDAPVPDGNVVSGNFYTAQQFGIIQGEDFEYTGFTPTGQVHAENIQRVLNNNDVVLLTTVGLSTLGELVNVNGYHLAAAVAAALKAYKVIYMSNEGSVLQKKGENISIQELPLSFAKAVLDYHHVEVHKTGFATFERARQSLEPHAVELLLHLGWASWALDHGVKRAHVVNPGDGALLEELFTSKNGANTCLYHDEENTKVEEEVGQDDWDSFFASAKAQGQKEIYIKKQQSNKRF